MTSRPRPHRLLLTVHIGVTVAVLGADLALLALGVTGLRGADPRTVYPAAHLLGQWLTAPLAVASLATGVLLAVRTAYKPWRYGWVAVKGVITLVLTGALLGVLYPGSVAPPTPRPRPHPTSPTRNGCCT